MVTRVVNIIVSVMFLTINDTNINILCKFGFLNGLVSVVWKKVKFKKWKRLVIISSTSNLLFLLFLLNYHHLHLYTVIITCILPSYWTDSSSYTVELQYLKHRYLKYNRYVK